MLAAPSRFRTALRVEKIGPRRWLLIDDLEFLSASLRGVLVAPAGFQTDFASIPRPAWTLLPPVGRYDAAAVMHDAGYANALQTEDGQRVFLIKRLCDDLFADALGALAVGGWRRGLMVGMVRRYGDPKGHPLSAHAGPLADPRLHAAASLYSAALTDHDVLLENGGATRTPPES